MFKVLSVACSTLLLFQIISIVGMEREEDLVQAFNDLSLSADRVTPCYLLLLPPELVDYILALALLEESPLHAYYLKKVCKTFKRMFDGYTNNNCEKLIKLFKSHHIFLGLKSPYYGGENLLHRALHEENVDFAIELVKEGVHPLDYYDDRRKTPLYVAYLENKIYDQFVEQLKALNYDEKEIGDSIAKTKKDLLRTKHPLLQAIEKNDLEKVREFLEKSKRGAIDNSSGSEGMSRLAYLMIAPYHQGKSEKVFDLLIDKGSDINGRVEKRPIIEAILSNNEYLLEKILATRNVQVDALDEHNETALIHACLGGNVVLVNKLLRAGADVNGVRKIVKEGQEKCADVLWTPLIGASYNGHFNIVQVLLNQKDIKVNEYDFDGKSALWYACFYGYSDIVELLIKAGALVDEPDNEGDTPLHAAMERNSISSVRFLLDAGALVDVKNKSYFSLYQYAVASGREDVISLMTGISKDKQLGEEDLNYSLAAACIRPQFDRIKELIKLGANPLFLYDSDINFIQLQCFKGGLDTQKALGFLFDETINPHFSLKYFDEHAGRTPLSLACSANNSEIAQFLIDKGAPVDYVLSNGGTALHFACLDQSFECVKVLVEAGADLFRATPAGKTPLDFAKQKKDKRIMSYLKVEIKKRNPTNNQDKKRCLVS